jgi:hypothetical protein
MRPLLLLATLFFTFSVVAAQQHSEWQTVRSVADGFSVEMPGTPKISTQDLGNGATQKNFVVEIGGETYLASVIQLAKGRGPGTPDETYFAALMKGYTEGSTTTLRSSRMITWAGHTAMEGIADAAPAVHRVDITAAGDRIYLVVFGGSKGQENGTKATRMRDSFKLLGN